MRAARHLLPFALTVLGSCHSLGVLQLHQNVRSASEAVVLDLWCDAPGPVLSEDQPVFDAAIGLVLFPLDKLMSLVQAMRAPFDGDYDVRWGPLGAFVGCTVPWVTLIPYIYPPPPLADVVLQREDFERLLERLHVGDGIAAYREIIGNRPGCADLAAVRAVRISDRPPSARPTAMAPSTRGSIRCWRGGEHR